MKKVKSILAVIIALIMSMSCISVAFAADVTETDAANGVIADADVFSIGDTVTGKINSSDDVDYYAFTVTKAGRVTITVEHAATAEATGTYFAVEIVNEEGKVIASFDVAANDASVSSPAFGAAAGKYLVKVTKGSVCDTTVEYKIKSAIDTNAYCEYEANDTRDKATAITLSSTTSLKKYSGTIPAAEDVDYYKFDVKKPGYIYIYVENDAAFKGDFELAVQTYSEGTDGLAEWTTFGKCEISKADAKFKSPAIGVAGDTEYYLSVTGTEGGYTIYVVYSEDASSEAEYNDKLAYANALEMGKMYYCSAFDKLDVDYYSFNIKSNYNYTVKVKADPMTVKNDGQWKVTVLDVKGATVAGPVTVTKDQGAEIELKDFAAGKYFVKVESGDVLNTNIYTIECAETEKEPPAPGFLDLFKKIDWQTLINNFSGWVGQINFIKIIMDISASLIALFAQLGAK